MELDLTRLNSLAFTDFKRKQGKKQAPESLTEPRNASGEYKPSAEQENALKRQLEGLQGLQRKADQNKAEIDHNLEVYRTYQENIKRSGQLQTEILKGAKAGESVYSLLLKACKAISLMTSDSVFYSQLEEDIRAIYGQGLLDPLPLRIELQETQERLTRLREALNREIEPDAKERIQRAVKTHEAKIADLESLIQKDKTA